MTKKKTVKLILSLGNNSFAFVVGKLERVNAEVEMSTGLMVGFLVFMDVVLCIVQFYAPRCFGRLQRLYLQGPVGPHSASGN
jgi:hypothetical protein